MIEVLARYWPGGGGAPPAATSRSAKAAPKLLGPLRGPGHPRVCQWTGRVPAWEVIRTNRRGTGTCHRRYAEVIQKSSSNLYYE